MNETQINDFLINNHLVVAYDDEINVIEAIKVEKGHSFEKIEVNIPPKANEIFMTILGPTEFEKGFTVSSCNAKGHLKKATVIFNENKINGLQSNRMFSDGPQLKELLPQLIDFFQRKNDSSEYTNILMKDKYADLLICDSKGNKHPPEMDSYEQDFIVKFMEALKTKDLTSLQSFIYPKDEISSHAYDPVFQQFFTYDLEKATYTYMDIDRSHHLNLNADTYHLPTHRKFSISVPMGHYNNKYSTSFFVSKIKGSIRIPLNIPEKSRNNLSANSELSPKETMTEEDLRAKKFNQEFFKMASDNITIQLGKSIFDHGIQKLVHDLYAPTISPTQTLLLEYGVYLPPINIDLNTSLNNNGYQILINNIVVGQGSLEADRWAVFPEGRPAPSGAIPFKEPIHGLEALWIHIKDKQDYLNCPNFSPTRILSAHLKEIATNHLSQLFTLEGYELLLERYKKTYPLSLSHLLSHVISKQDLMKLLKELLQERISLRSFRKIIESIGIIKNKKNGLITAQELINELKGQ